ncbi:MAG: PAS domain S-box protein, partial [Methanobacteriota archaeon]
LHQYISFFLFSLRSSDNAIILLNHNGKVLSVNQKVNQFLGLQEPVKQREHFAESLQHRPMVVEAIEECRQNGQQVQRRFSFEDARKSFIGEITVTPFRAFLGHVSAYLVEIKDSTREVLMERQQNWQRNVRKLVHDIKTPLAGVQLKLQSLFMKISENQHLMDEEILKGLEAAHDELLRIRNISKDFLKFSDLQQIQPRALNPQKFLEQCITPFKLYSNEKLKINLRISPELPEEVYWDERQIELLLHIIVENSLDALKGRGMIEVEAKPVSGANQSDVSFVEIRISDNGPGIPPEHQGKIFEPHFTTKKEGTGLGLTFAKQIVLQHGGQIEFFSVPSSGTVFVLTIPVAIKESSTG